MRSIPGLVSLLLLLLPLVGSAQHARGRQQSARLSLLPRATATVAPDSALPPRLLSQEDSMGVSRDARDPLTARVTGEVLLGALAGAGGLLAGGLVGMAVAESVTCGIDDCLDGVDIVGVGMVTGIALIAPIGVYFAGRHAEGEGLFLPTLSGSLVSGGLTALTLAAMSRSVSPLGVLVLAISPLVGSIIGYEVSHAFVSRGRRSAAASGVQVLPSAGVTRSGAGVLGLAGRF